MKLQNLFFTATAVQSHKDARIQEDCGQCDMLQVVPEMYWPNPTYGDSAVGAGCIELASVGGRLIIFQTACLGVYSTAKSSLD